MQKKNKRRKPMPERSTPFPGPQELPSISSSSEQLWVRPESNLRQGREAAGEKNISPTTGERLLALADVALGVKKSAAKGKSKLLSVEAHHQKMSQQKKKAPLQSN